MVALMNMNPPQALLNYIAETENQLKGFHRGLEEELHCYSLKAGSAFYLHVRQCLGGPIPKTNKIVTLICSCHNFFPLSSVQILFIQACCLLCVL